MTGRARPSEIRRLVADLLGAAGCGCCRDNAGYEAAKTRLAAILRVPKYPDGSGHDFNQFRTSKRRQA